MKLVIDANIVLAALMKPSKTQELIYSKKLELITPDFCLKETKKYSKLIVQKSGKTKEQIELAIELIFSEIQLIPKKEYSKNKKLALQHLKDEKDWPFLALAITKNTPIWSNDKHLINQTIAKNYTTKQLIEKINKKVDF